MPPRFTTPFRIKAPILPDAGTVDGWELSDESFLESPSAEESCLPQSLIPSWRQPHLITEEQRFEGPAFLLQLWSTLQGRPTSKAAHRMDWAHGTVTALLFSFSSCPSLFPSLTKLFPSNLSAYKSPSQSLFLSELVWQQLSEKGAGVAPPKNRH